VPPRIRIEPSSLPISFEVFEGRHAAPEPGELLVLDSGADNVRLVVLLDVSGARIRYELELWTVGLHELTVMHVEETSRLFLGGRQSSCVVDLATMTIEHRFEHCLFWGFDRAARPGFVLETGELDCLFRGLDGRVLGRVPVDPPWEMFAEPGGLRFESIVYGSHLLAFPDAG
jgi:hypothetical protein